MVKKVILLNHLSMVDKLNVFHLDNSTDCWLRALLQIYFHHNAFSTERYFDILRILRQIVGNNKLRRIDDDPVPLYSCMKHCGFISAPVFTTLRRHKLSVESFSLTAEVIADLLECGPLWVGTRLCGGHVIVITGVEGVGKKGVVTCVDYTGIISLSIKELNENLAKERAKKIPGVLGARMDDELTICIFYYNPKSYQFLDGDRYYLTLLLKKFSMADEKEQSNITVKIDKMLAPYARMVEDEQRFEATKGYTSRRKSPVKELWDKAQEITKKSRVKSPVILDIKLPEFTAQLVAPDAKAIKSPVPKVDVKAAANPQSPNVSNAVHVDFYAHHSVFKHYSKAVERKLRTTQSDDLMKTNRLTG